MQFATRNLTSYLMNSEHTYGAEGWLGFPNLWFGQKPCWNWYLTSVVNFGEVKRASLCHIHSPSPPSWCPGDIFRSFKVCQVLERERERVGCRKQCEATSPIQSLVKLQPWFLSLRLKICLRQICSLGSCDRSEGPAIGQNTLMMMTHIH